MVCLDKIIWEKSVGQWEKRGATKRLIYLAHGKKLKSAVFDSDKLGFNAWHYWAHYENPDLKNKGLPIDYMHKKALNEYTGLHYLAFYGKKENLEKLIENFSLYPDGSLLHACAWSGHEETFSWALEKAAEAELNTVYLGEPLCVVALYRLGISAARRVIQRGADPDARDGSGRTVLHHSAKMGEVDFMMELEGMGGSLYFKDSQRQTPNAIYESIEKFNSEVYISNWKHRFNQIKLF